MRPLFLFLLLAFSGFAQNAVPQPNPVNATYLPPMFAAAGASYNGYATPKEAAGWLSVAIQLGTGSRMYTITTIDITPKTSSLRQGAAYMVYQGGGFYLFTHIDGGATSANTVVGSFSGGMMVMYDLGYLIKPLNHIFVIGVVRIVTTAGSATVPVYEIGFGRPAA